MAGNRLKGGGILQIAAYFEDMLYDSSNYKVMSCSTNDESAADIPQRKFFAKKEKYVFTVVLRDFPMESKPDKSKQYIFNGKWKTEGIRTSFIAYSYEINYKNSKDDILAFLETFEGVGQKTAQTIYKAFGLKTMEILKENINKLYELKLPKSRIDKMIADYGSKKCFKETMEYFSQFSISFKKAKYIYEMYKENAVLTMKVNPFELSETECLSFAEANSVAIDLGVELDSGERQRQALIYIMSAYFRTKGDLFFLIDDVLSLTQKFLNHNVPKDKTVSLDSLKARLQEINNKDVKIYGNYVYLIKDLFAEQKTAELLVDFLNYDGNLFKLDKDECYNEIKEIEKEVGFSLNEAQKKAIFTAVSSNVSIITGGPGTGKTTLLKFILRIFQRNFSNNIRLCSPTGKAARRMAESTGFVSASTIHSLLGISPDYKWSMTGKNTQSVNADLLIVDESSMLDMELMYLLISSIPFTCKLVFLGDADQLPSVGPGNVLREMINSKVIPTAILDKIYRQSEQSNIVKNAYLFNKGDADSLIYDEGNSINDSFVIRKRKGDINNQLADIFCNSVKKSGSVEDVQILSPYKNPAIVASTERINRIIQERINPFTSEENEIVCKKNIFRINDRVIQQKNTATAKNGDVGTIIGIDSSDNKPITVTIDFGDDNIVDYSIDEMEENKVSLAYALTVHKSQGSEYKTVILPCVSEHEQMLTKKLVYTAWTRAKEHIIMVGDKDTIKKAAKNNSETVRNTVFAKRIIKQFQKNR